MKREEILLLLVFLLFLQGYLFQNVLPALLASAISLYLIYLRAEFTPQIEVERDVGRKLREGVREKTRLKLKNLGNKNLKIEVLENLPPGFKAEEPSLFLRGDEEREVEYFIIPVRGLFKISGPRIRVEDTRELYYADFTVDSEKEVEVYPNIDKIREDAEAEMRFKFTETCQTLLGLQSLEIDSLRGFQSGDDRRHIDWKATMRLGELIVKDFLKETEGDVYLILDAGKEMRKGIKSSKIDFATTLMLQLAYALRKHRVGLVVYNDFGVKRAEAAKSGRHVEKMVASLKIEAVYSPLLGIKLPEMGFKLKEESRKFIGKILPAIKGRKSFASGLIEAINSLPSTAFLIFISDITANTSELIKVLLRLRKGYKILLLTPNPILFYDDEKLDRETLIWLYKGYKERDGVIKKLNRIVPTFDLGPSDLLKSIRGALE